jgi:hypothetical protein
VFCRPSASTTTSMTMVAARVIRPKYSPGGVVQWHCGKPRLIPRYGRHGHQNRSIRRMTSGLLIEVSECTITTPISCLPAGNLLASNSSQMFRSSSLEQAGWHSKTLIHNCLVTNCHLTIYLHNWGFSDYTVRFCTSNKIMMCAIADFLSRTFFVFILLGVFLFTGNVPQVIK